MFKLFNRSMVLVVLATYLLVNILSASEYNDIIKKVFANKKLESIEGIWTKTLANQGPAGCVTMFYKDENEMFYQIHIDQCFVMGKITGKQKKLSEYKYEGENAVY